MGVGGAGVRSDRGRGGASRIRASLRCGDRVRVRRVPGVRGQRGGGGLGVERGLEVGLVRQGAADVAPVGDATAGRDGDVDLSAASVGDRDPGAGEVEGCDRRDDLGAVVLHGHIRGAGAGDAGRADGDDQADRSDGDLRRRRDGADGGHLGDPSSGERAVDDEPQQRVPSRQGDRVRLPVAGRLVVGGAVDDRVGVGERQCCVDGTADVDLHGGRHDWVAGLVAEVDRQGGGDRSEELRRPLRRAGVGQVAHRAPPPAMARANQQAAPSAAPAMKKAVRLTG